MQSALATQQELPLYGWRSPELGTARRVELPEGGVNVYERGKGPALLFSHGWLANANLWRHVVPILSRRFRCIVPDWPLGAHLQPMNERFDGSPEGIARIINGVIDMLGIEDVTLVGNDSGGAYSQLAAAARPERVRALVLNACESPYDPFPPVAFRNLQEAARSPASLVTLLSAMRSREVRRTPAAFGHLIKYPIADEVSDSYVLPALEIPDVRRDASKVMPAASQASVAAAGQKLIANFRGRVLFVWPTEDRFFSLENVRRYAGELQNARVALIEDSFAFTPEDQPARMAELIGEELAA